jgi:hypothetical protein
MKKRKCPRHISADYRSPGLDPSMEIRVEAAKELYPTVVNNWKTADPNTLADWDRRSSWIRFGEEPTLFGMIPGNIIAFWLHSFLEENGINGWKLVQT